MEQAVCHGLAETHHKHLYTSQAPPSRGSCQGSRPGMGSCQGNDIAGEDAKAAGQEFATPAQLLCVEAATQKAVDAAAAVDVSAIETAKASGSLQDYGTEASRAELQAAWRGRTRGLRKQEGHTAWWSRLLGCKGQRWRVRSDCYMDFMYVMSGPETGDHMLHEMRRGDQCTQADKSQMFLHHHTDGNTVILKMAILPKGWIAVAMRGAENFGFLEKDDEVEREDRTDEGQGHSWPGLTLPFGGSARSVAGCFPRLGCPAGAFQRLPMFVGSTKYLLATWACYCLETVGG